MKTKIFAPFDCVVRTEKEEFFISKNDHFSFEQAPKTIAVYPTKESGIIPFAIDINSPSIFYKILEKDGVCNIFLLNGLYVEDVLIHSFPQQSTAVEISNKKISFQTKTERKEIDLPPACKDFQCDNFGFICYCIFSHLDEKVLLCFNCKTQGLKTFYAQNISVTKNGFILSLANGQQQELYVDTSGLRQKEGSRIKLFANPFNIPLCFMQCVQAKDYEGARSFLAASLLSYDENSLRDFFGNVEYLHPISNNEIFAMCSGQAKIFSFSLNAGKIEDINDECD